MSEEGLLAGVLGGWSWPLFWLAAMGLAALAGFVWSLILWSAHDWPNVTQTNRKTGITHHGGWYKTRRIVIGAVAGPTVFCLISVWLWHWQAIVAPLLLAGMGLALYRWWPQQDRGMPVPPPDDRERYLTRFQPPQYGPPPADQPIWSLPANMRDGGLG